MKLQSVFLACASLLVCAPALAEQVSGADEERVDPAEFPLPAVIDDGGRQIAAGTNDFGLSLFRQIGSERGDQLISPASISAAFGMAYAGAKGNTAREIATVLRYPQGVKDFHGSFGQLLKSIEIDRIGRKMSVNNAIWIQNEVAVLPEYQALVDKNYAAGLRRVDFRSDPDAARVKINTWVEEKTNKKIRNLLSPLNVTKSTRSVLVNTIYMKADWADPFQEKLTKEEDFTLGSGQKVKHPLMHQRNHYAYAERDGTKAIALPYRGGEADMVVLLPKSEKGLEKLEAGLTPEAWKGWNAALEGAEVILTLPKFKIEKRYELPKALKAMGMQTPLSDASDFSGMKAVNMLSLNQEDWNFKIGNVIHQTFVEVEEKGTEAAAATAITMEIVISGVVNPKPPPPPKIFRADHPFLFIIRDRRTGAMLFMGRYTGAMLFIGRYTGEK